MSWSWLKMVEDKMEKLSKIPLACGTARHPVWQMNAGAGLAKYQHDSPYRRAQTLIRKVCEVIPAYWDAHCKQG